ncbi:hypothetical protein MRB53_041410 [Persea americana]|nr:hypothetical protein MRB53_041410 [Persea americana]
MNPFSESFCSVSSRSSWKTARSMSILRATFITPFIKEKQSAPDDNYNMTKIMILGEEIEKFKATTEGKGFWGARKMIWTLHSQVSTIGPSWTVSSG